MNVLIREDSTKDSYKKKALAAFLTHSLSPAQQLQLWSNTQQMGREATPSEPVSAIISLLMTQNLTPLGHLCSLLLVKHHFMAKVTVVQKFFCKRSVGKKYPREPHVFTNDLELIRKGCVLTSSAHVSALIKLFKKKKALSKLGTAMANKLELGSSEHIPALLCDVRVSAPQLNLSCTK